MKNGLVLGFMAIVGSNGMLFGADPAPRTSSPAAVASRQFIPGFRLATAEKPAANRNSRAYPQRVEQPDVFLSKFEKDATPFKPTLIQQTEYQTLSHTTKQPVVIAPSAWVAGPVSVSMRNVATPLKATASQTMEPQTPSHTIAGPVRISQFEKVATPLETTAIQTMESQTPKRTIAGPVNVVSPVMLHPPQPDRIAHPKPPALNAAQVSPTVWRTWNQWPQAPHAKTSVSRSSANP